jgi:hypothetical protein
VTLPTFHRASGWVLGGGGSSSDMLLKSIVLGMEKEVFLESECSFGILVHWVDGRHGRVRHESDVLNRQWVR